MAKKWWNKQNEQARAGEANAAPEPESEVPASEQVDGPVTGAPSREQQEAESQRVAATAPAATAAEIESAVASSGNVKARVAPSAPGGTITTKDGTFTAAEWEERQRLGREISE